jgi:hypothetical protein
MTGHRRRSGTWRKMRAAAREGWEYEPQTAFERLQAAVAIAIVTVVLPTDQANIQRARLASLF